MYFLNAKAPTAEQESCKFLFILYAVFFENQGTFLRNASAVPEVTSALAEKISTILEHASNINEKVSTTLEHASALGKKTSIALSRLPNPGRKQGRSRQKLSALLIYRHDASTLALRKSAENASCPRHLGRKN